ncbi:hypothetical protein AX16_003870 [Volvariella volvacea WC 439]|nr:hypothetical protein AX16_003870 [Volvariella volvacea WC 439]
MSQNSNPEWLHFLATRYPAVKAQYPDEGRRQWRLRVIQEFWNSVNLHFIRPSAATEVPDDIQAAVDEISDDGDPWDELSEAREFGLLIRADRSNEAAWQAFLVQLQDAEQKMAVAVRESRNMTEEQMAGIDEDDDAFVPYPLVRIVDPDDADDRAAFEGISNIGALRLLNDVDVRRAPVPAPGQRRIKPGHRLVDLGGLQEIYSGTDIWIYDALSNQDGCARVVCQEGDSSVYGTATADSWRARAAHIPDLQFSKVCLGMQINYGGLDRYDQGERARNLIEAEAPIS